MFTIATAARTSAPPAPSQERVEPPAMYLSLETEVVIGNDATRGQILHLIQTGVEVLRAAVENCRWKMDKETVAGKQIAGEEQVMGGAVEAAMALGVSGQMDNAKASPVWQLHACMQRLIDGGRTVTKQRAPTGLQRTADAAGAAIGKIPFDVPLLRWVRHDGSASEPLQLLEMSSVIEMAMGEQDRADVAPTEAESFANARQLAHLAYQPGIDDDRFAARFIIEKMEVTQEPANRIDPLGRAARIKAITRRHRPRIIDRFAIASCPVL